MKSILLAASAALLLSLAACGGGAGQRPDQPLSIDDGSPEAYTVAYLNDHPELLVQPEHLIVARLDPSTPEGRRQSVRLHIREAMTLSLGSGDTASALSEVAIEDEGRQLQLRHRHGEEAASVTLQPGAYRLVFTASEQLAKPQTLFLKLADTPAQAARRRQAAERVQAARPERGLAAAAATTSLTALGMVSGDVCMPCSFDGADLSNQDLSNTFLGGSTFVNTKLFNTNFTSAYCYQCTFTVSGDPGSTNFTNADLDATHLTGYFVGVNFSGALLQNAVLSQSFMSANFGPSAQQATSMRGANLYFANLWNANVQYADLTGATIRSDSQFNTFYVPQVGHLASQAFVGVKFDNVTPASMWAFINPAGMDFTGTSFAGMDLSHLDLSVANGVKVTAAGLAQAILSDGTTGTNLSGQDFGAAFTGWAGTMADEASGKDLRGVNLSNASLYQADLTRANLGGANLVGANLSDANLYAASLRGAQLGVAPGSGTGRPANLGNAYMPLADLTDADLRSANLAAVHLYTFDGTSGVSLQRARLDSASLAGAVLIGANFTQASLNDTNLTGAVLVNASFSGATLSNTKLAGASLQGASFGNVASIIGTDLNNAAVAATGVTLVSRNPYQFTDFDAVTHSYAYGLTDLGPLATSNQVTCPSGASGPCTTPALLTAATQPPYPPAPKCVPLLKYRFENCSPGWVPPASGS